MDSKTIHRLAECALLIAVGTVLSLFEFKGIWALGGGITFCAMLPLVMIAQRHGTKWGVGCALVYSLIQLVLGLSNVQYAPDALTAIGIILLDYVLAFSVIGFSACFNKFFKDRRWGVVVGIVVTFSLRLLCHFLSGLIIWEVLWPNGEGWAPAVWSIAYNASYMVPEMIITSVVAFVSFAPLKKYWMGDAIVK
ncbi:MAG: energy-coupled thiamine transporter ThiT [Eubacteriales bacterium]|nr:energy-coupled thiamine transporter ThiT [Eubacteriales bacterium]